MKYIETAFFLARYLGLYLIINLLAALSTKLFPEDTIPEKLTELGLTSLLLAIILLIAVRYENIHIPYIPRKKAVLWPLLIIITLFIFNLIVLGVFSKDILDPGLNTNISLISLLTITYFFLKAAFEELFYRGILLHGLTHIGVSKMSALIISSIVFMVSHTFIMVNIQSFYYLLMGLLFGILALKYNNILAPIIAHGFWNVFAIITNNENNKAMLVINYLDQLDQWQIDLITSGSFLLCILLMWKQKYLLNRLKLSMHQ